MFPLSRFDFGTGFLSHSHFGATLKCTVFLVKLSSKPFQRTLQPETGMVRPESSLEIATFGVLIVIRIGRPVHKTSWQ